MTTTINKKTTKTIIEEELIADTTAIANINLPTGDDDSISGKTINRDGMGTNIDATETISKKESTDPRMSWAALVDKILPSLSSSSANRWIILAIILYIISFILTPKNFSIKGILYWLTVGTILNVILALFIVISLLIKKLSKNQKQQC